MRALKRTLLLTLAIVVAALGCGRRAIAVDNFAATGNMAMPRYGANAYLLTGGKVLIAGGRGLSGATTSAEIFDPATGMFSAGGNMVAAFLLRASSTLPGNKWLIVGGIDNAEHVAAGAEVYDSATGTFSATGNLGVARWDATATFLPNGKVLVAGGSDHLNQPMRSAELYDPASGTFAFTALMFTARIGHTATLLPSGNVLIAGGTDESSGLYPSAEIYDTATGTFAITGAMTSHVKGRYGATATLLPDGTVLIAGGTSTDSMLSSAEIFDENTGSFTATGNLATARYAAAASALAGGKVLIAGGADPSNPDNSIASAELYDPATGLFAAAAGMTAARQDATAITLPGGRILVAGGDDFDGAPLPSAEVYIANVIFRGAFDGP